ncbi:hypothetical protein K450DRAFT_263275 [Umbelopsis ramanniana AG]|uniref:Uncharacterized protein n=1 Tax=Umbelopsis ramanniana AG TaxID=1314678 RepID=A0AAD5HAG3_UMBRA|nr:uncharacterized protein K450DRAFT_263275 [Umbelopsis ramanniana AG]KAI8575103.1 hypothetical protein K450DRAFT_263275 [Umbelopsis ramanniana AG]
MGAQASKQVARKFPQHANPETLTQVPKTSPSSTPSSSHLNSTPDTAYVADDHKSEAIQEDGRDPDFAKKLNTIGQVNVPEFKTKYRPSDSMLQIMRQRSQVEKAEDFDPLLPKSQKAENRITIDDLYSLLEQRKLLPANASNEDLQQLTSKYPLNQQTVHTLFKYVNNITPFDVGSEDERQRGVWVENREGLKSYMQQAHAITKKREESRKAEKADKPNSAQPDSERRKKEKELEDLFTD